MSTVPGIGHYDDLHYGPRTLNRLPEGEDSKPFDLFDVHPLAPTIGAELGGVDLRRVTPELAAEIHRALLEWKVIFFRDQELTPKEHLALARHWGDAVPHPWFPDGAAAGVSRLEKGPDAPGHENIWHSDNTWSDPPPLGSILRAIEVPAVGGDTMWADMAAAYDNLDDDLKVRIEPLRAVHTWVHSWGRIMTEEEIATLLQRWPPVIHPVARPHPETGRKTLFVNEPFTERILGLDDPEEADGLLRFLITQARVPEYQVRFRWRPGSVAFWDNRAVQHYAVSDYFPQRRVMERVVVAG